MSWLLHWMLIRRLWRSILRGLRSRLISLRRSEETSKFKRPCYAALHMCGVCVLCQLPVVLTSQLAILFMLLSTAPSKQQRPETLSHSGLEHCMKFYCSRDL